MSATAPSGRPLVPSLIVVTARGRIEHPCPPDTRRMTVVVEGLAPFLDATAEWSYRP